MNWKDILKGEEIHPSVKGHQEKGKHKFRSEMIKLKQRLKPLEEKFKTKEVQNNKYMKEDYADRINTIKRQIKMLSEETGASFGAKKGKDLFTGREYDKSIEQRLSPSTKKPKVERMKRPAPEYSQDPDDSIDNNVIRRFNLSKKDWANTPEERKELYRDMYKTLAKD